MNKILKEVLQDIVPIEKEQKDVSTKIAAFLKRINSSLGDAKAILGGSMAKGTWIKGVYDADIFVQFPYSKYKEKSAEISDIVEKRIKKSFPKLSRLHGSRDYFQIRENGVTYEVIPILNVTNPKAAINITDISPLHAKWVHKYPGKSDEIRLVKSFCKAQGVYGAESYIRGFSGYVAEILSIHYGSFETLIRAASKWQPKTIIDPMKYHKNVMFEVNQSKLISPLVLIDPVQAGRNTAASLDLDNYLRFVKACQEYLKNPSGEFFKKKEITKESLKKLHPNHSVIFLEISPLEGKEDVIGGKLLKAFNFFIQKLENHDFQLMDKGWEFDREKKANFWFVVHPRELPKEKNWPGPPLKAKENVENFKRKYKKTFEKQNRIFAIVERKFTTPEELIKGLKKDIYLKDKITSFTIK